MSQSPSEYDSISAINLYDPTTEGAVDAVLAHINQLGNGEGDLPPFISVTKLKPGYIYTIKKMVKRIKGLDNAPMTGIQVYLDNCRTNFPSKDEFDLICLIVIKIMRSTTLIERIEDHLMGNPDIFNVFGAVTKLFRFDGVKKLSSGHDMALGM